MKMSVNKETAYRVRKKLKAILPLVLLLLILLYVLSVIFYPEWYKKIYSSADAENIAEYSEKYDFNLHFIDVGKADCILIDAGGKYLLVDSGTSDSKDLILNYLRSAEITELDAVISTHPDSDHYGSFSYLSDYVDFKAFYMSEAESDSAQFDDLLDKLEKKEIPISFLYGGDELAFGNLKLEVLAPLTIYDDSNSMSIVMRCTFGNFTFLLTGDMSLDEIDDILGSGVDVRADLIKVSHHGSKTGTTEELLHAVGADYAVILCGPNSYGLPSAETLELIENSGALIYDTEESGNIIFSLDENGEIVIHTEY